MRDETRRMLISVGMIVAWLVFLFVALPWVINELGAIPLEDVPSLMITGFGLAAWMLFRIEQAIDRGIARLDTSIHQASTAECSAIGRVESDTEMIRDTFERVQSVGDDLRATVASVDSPVNLLRQDMADVVALLEEIRNELQVFNRGAGRGTGGRKE